MQLYKETKAPRPRRTTNGEVSLTGSQLMEQHRRYRTVHVQADDGNIE